MRSFARCGKSILTFALLFVILFCAAAFAQEMEKPGVAVFVTGDIPGNERKVLGTYLLASIVKNGHGVSAENSDAFLAAAMGDKQTVRDGAVNKGRICELGRQFNTRYVCVASVVPAFSFFVISTNMIDTETEEVIYKGEAQSPLKTIDDLTQVCNNLVVSMFGVEASNEQTVSTPTTPQNDEPVAEAASTTVVSVAGDAKTAVDKVVAAVNAFKAATNESVAAANAVKTATQSKSFSAIKEAKKKVERATEAVKKAKADAEEAVEALKAAGPEAEAAAKALGIDLAMFAKKEKEKDVAKGDNGSNINAGETTLTRKTKNGFSLGYVFSGDVNIFQAGFAQTRPIGEKGLSFVWGINLWDGEGSGYRDHYNYYDGGGYDYYIEQYTYTLIGVNIPLLFQFDVSVLSLEAGTQVDILYTGGMVFNVGFVAGGGLQFGFARFFYRFNYGTGYYSQMFGIRMMF